MKLPFLLLLTLFIPSRASAGEAPCPQVVIDGKDRISLDDTEKRMVCGDQELEGYALIPPYQAQLFMQGFLQSRGHLNPTFEVKGGVLHVHAGEVTRVKAVRAATGLRKEDKEVEDEVARRYRKRELTPKLLNDVEADGLRVVRKRGFPCAKVVTLADSAEGRIHLNYERMTFLPFGEMAKEEIKGLHRNALTRFYPMGPSDPFNEELLELTEKRMLRTEVVSGTYFLEKCSPDAKDFALSQSFIVGPPRTIRFGAGANTEVGPMARARWSNNRFQSMASQLSATLQASFRVQSLKLTADQFLWPEHPRRSLFSQLELTRESQYDYLQSLARLRPHMKWTEDKGSGQWTYAFGPTLEAGSFKALKNNSSTSYKTGALEGSLKWMSHAYEWYDQHPQDGSTLGFSFDYRNTNFGFPENLLKLETTLAKLAQVGVWGRGDVIAGARVNAGTTVVPRASELIDLPPLVKFYGGGSDDVRGFLLQTLPKNDGQGALTKLGLKLELRRTYLLHKSFEGFTFLDSAYFGDESWTLRQRLWYSPGLGLTWFSPIGMVQAYAARARATHPDQDFSNFYFIGLGGTF